VLLQERDFAIHGIGERGLSKTHNAQGEADRE